MESVYLKRYKVEKLLAIENHDKETWFIIGYCECCEKETKFLIDWLYSNGEMPNYRERLICQHCGLNNRQRFIGSSIKNIINNVNVKDVYLYEQVTQFYNFVSQKFKSLNVIGSEYLGTDKQSGQVIKGIRHEDALNLSFESASLDIIISNDVYEHVPDIMATLTEANRVLRPNGKLLFTVPFHHTKKETRKRATLKDGNIIFHLPGEYHGNPVSPKGSLVYYDFGWDLLNMCKDAGFKDAYVLTYYSLFYGYLGEGVQIMLVAEK